MAICPHCGREVPDDAVVCPYCGAQLREDVAVCGNCGRIIPADAKICPYCGAPLADVAICPKCGRQIPADAKSCPYCGYRFDRDMPVVNIEYVKKSEPAHPHIYKIRGVKERKPAVIDRVLGLTNNKYLNTPKGQAMAGAIISIIILILGLIVIGGGLYTSMSVKIPNNIGPVGDFLESLGLGYLITLIIEAVFLFYATGYAFKVLLTGKGEIAAAFLFAGLLILYLVASQYGFFIGLIWSMEQTSAGQQNTTSILEGATLSIYINVFYTLLIATEIMNYGVMHAKKEFVNKSP